MEFFPSNKRTPEHFNAVFQEKDLADIVKLQKSQASQEIKGILQKVVADALEENKGAKEIIAEVKDYTQKNVLPEHDIVTIVRNKNPCFDGGTDLYWGFGLLQIWAALMAAIEWNKKEELVAEQALKHIKV